MTKRTVIASWLIASVTSLSCATSQGRLAPIPMPLAAPSSPEQLVQELGSPDPISRRNAAWQLAGAPQPTAAMLQSLRASFQDESPAVREAAAWALAHLKMMDIQTRDLYDDPPSLVSQTRPKYPEDAFSKGIEGIVIVELLISEEGRVAHAEIRESIPPLDGAALESVRQWTFIPARKSGRPVPSMARAPVTFRIYDR